MFILMPEKCGVILAYKLYRCTHEQQSIKFGTRSTFGSIAHYLFRNLIHFWPT